MFAFNGHGTTIPSNYSYFADSIELNPGEFIIMNKTANALRGSGWIQNAFFNNVLTSKTKKQFIENIHMKINKSSEKTNPNDIFGYFGYTNDLDMTEYNSLCPNIKLSSLNEESLFSDRFGLFNVPIIINEVIMNDLLKKNNDIKYQEVKRIERLKKIPSNLSHFNEDNRKQLYNLIQNYDWTFYNKNNFDLKGLIDFIRINLLDEKNKTFILFLNVCRSLSNEPIIKSVLRPDEFVYPIYKPISLKYALPLTELIDKVQKNVLSVDAKEWVPSNDKLLTSNTKESISLNADAKEWVPSNDKKNIVNYNFKQKYLKYKQKYLKLKNNL